MKPHFVLKCHLVILLTVCLIALFLFAMVGVPVILTLEFPAAVWGLPISVIIIVQIVACIVLSAFILFFVPLRASKRPAKPISDKALTLIREGNWVSIYRIDNDPDFLVKKWHDVFRRRSSTEKMFRFHPYGNARNRNLFDWIAWHFMMLPSWKSNVRSFEAYRGKITCIPEVRDVNESALALEQEKCLAFGPEDAAWIKERFEVINAQLVEYNRWYVDIHSGNLMRSRHNEVVFVDGELLGPFGYFMARLLYRWIGDRMVPIQHFDRICWSHEERRRQPPIDAYNGRQELIKGKYENEGAERA